MVRFSGSSPSILLLACGRRRSLDGGMSFITTHTIMGGATRGVDGGIAFGLGRRLAHLSLCTGIDRSI